MKIIGPGDYFFDSATVTSLRFQIEKLLVSYRRLSVAGFQANPREVRWHEVPKFHYALHVGLQAAFGNPRFSWTYADEDFMGHVKTICGIAPRALLHTRW